MSTTSRHRPGPAAPGAPGAPSGRGEHVFPGLDGVRALAVVAVLLYHGGIGWAQGGFLGVDVFFVLSGFLITSLLLAEREWRGTISLRSFWARRARRLLPALCLMLVGVALYAAVAAPPDLVDTIRKDALATLLYVANWRQAFSPTGYFAAGQAPSPLLHTWSLAIEEQFYVLWPVVVLVVLRLGRTYRWLLAWCLAGAAASALEMALLYRGGAGLDRVYDGTDTRAQDLLVGGALAVFLAMARARRAEAGAGRSGLRPFHLGDGAGRVAGVATLAGLAGVLVALAWSRATSGWLYHGGYLLVSLAAAAVVGGVAVAPGGPGARLLSWAPLRALGRISYGVYLWHWPVYVWLDASAVGVAGWALLAVRVAVTLVLALASYFVVELPFRRGVLRGWVMRAVAPAGVVATAAVVLAATVAPPGAAALGAVVNLPPTSMTTRGVPPGTVSVLPHVPAGAGGPIRVLHVGDSEAVFIGFGLGALSTRYGVDYGLDGVIQCGLISGGPTMVDGHTETTLLGFRATREVQCGTQLTRWRNDIEQFHPDVILLQEGALEVRDHEVDGRWMHLGQPFFDLLERTALERALRLLTSFGIPVAVLNAPYYDPPPAADGSPYPEGDPARVRVFNRIEAEVVAGFKGRVTLLDLNSRVDPGGHFAATIDGQPMRYSDGVHLTPQAGRLIAPWLFGRLLALGRAYRARAG